MLAQYNTKIHGSAPPACFYRHFFVNAIIIITHIYIVITTFSVYHSQIPSSNRFTSSHGILYATTISMYFFLISGVNIKNYCHSTDHITTPVRLCNNICCPYINIHLFYLSRTLPPKHTKSRMKS